MCKDCCAAVSCACAGLILLAIGGIAATLEMRKLELRSAPAGECSFKTPANMGSSFLLPVTCASRASAHDLPASHEFSQGSTFAAPADWSGVLSGRRLQTCHIADNVVQGMWNFRCK